MYQFFAISVLLWIQKLNFFVYNKRVLYPGLDAFHLKS